MPGCDSQFGSGYGTVFVNAAGWDNGAVVTVPSVGNVTLVCDLSATATTFANQPSSAEATPLDSVATGVVTAAPGRPAGSPATSGTAPRP